MGASTEKCGILGSDVLVAGDPKVGEFPAAVVAKNVARFEVAVDDADGVKVPQSGGDVSHGCHDVGFGHRQGNVPERALCSVHNKEQRVAGFGGIYYRQQYVASASGDPSADVDLAAQKAMVERAAAVLLVDNFDGHGHAITPFTSIDAAKSAGPAQGLVYPVAVGGTRLPGEGYFVCHESSCACAAHGWLLAVAGRTAR